jgi:hypothetical protein
MDALWLFGCCPRVPGGSAPHIGPIGARAAFAVRSVAVGKSETSAATHARGDGIGGAPAVDKIKM